MARQLGLKRSGDARAAFLRALRGRPEPDRGMIVAREHQRLDKLEARIRDRDAAEPEKRERRLVALAKLREELN